MARPKEFEREAAVIKAMAVFRRQGYAATTTEDLRLAMGIGRQSFYDTFIGKKTVFDEALSLYNDARVDRFHEAARGPISPLEAIERILMTIADESEPERSLLCLGVASVDAFADTDPEVNRINEFALERIRTLFESLLAEAQRTGAAPASLDRRQAAQYLSVLLNGLRVQARSGASRDELAGVVGVALRALRA